MTKGTPQVVALLGTNDLIYRLVEVIDTDLMVKIILLYC